jgi:hypothetical protein
LHVAQSKRGAEIPERRHLNLLVATKIDPTEHCNGHDPSSMHTKPMYGEGMHDPLWIKSLLGAGAASKA